MKIGKLRQVITIEKKVEHQDSFGGMVVGWQSAGTCYAKIEALSGKEYLAAAAILSEVDTKITTRYLEIEVTDRIIHGNEIYNIQAILPDPKSGKEYLNIMCKS